MKRLAALSVLLFSANAMALPLLNETVSFREPIPLIVHPDSDNPNRFWFHPLSYVYCDSGPGRPDFSYKSIAVDGKPVVAITYKLCPEYNRGAVAKAARELTSRNPINELSLLQPDILAIDSGMWTDWIDTFKLKLHYHCSVENKEKQIIACQINSTDVRTCRQLHNSFTGFIGLITAGYFAHYYEGVRASGDGTSLQKFHSLANVAFFVRGLKDHPELFSHGWKP